MLRSTYYPVAALVFALLGLPQPARAKDPKLKPEDLVTRHLESIGAVDAIRNVKSRALNCSVEATTQFGRAGTMPGRASVVSKGNLTRVGIFIDIPEYPGEQFAFDGSKVTVTSLLPGVYSWLGAFLYQNQILLKEGLIGGALTTAWPLLDLETRKPLLSYSGLKKVAGKQYHTLRYRPNKGPMASTATLFFEPETFRHVRTEVHLKHEGGSDTTAPRLEGSAPRPPDVRRFTLVEEFEDFHEEEGLKLPRTYRIKFTADTVARTVMSTWELTVIEVVQNPVLEDTVFTLR